MNRRAFLNVMVGTSILNTPRQAALEPVIDTHIHLFDPRRPGGVPWPEKDDATLYHPALPDRYRSVTKGLPVVGAIEVECSPWLEDNQWVLDVAAKDTIIVGTVGNLEPGKPGFRRYLEHFHENPIFRGIRCGNLWGRDLAHEILSREFISDLKALADAGLELDTANPNVTLISAVLRMTDQVPGLRIVIDHLPQLEPPADTPTRQALLSDLRELGNRPQVYVKVSEVLRRVSGKVPEDLNFYKATLDEIWDTFGEDRLIYGSDWPNSDRWAPYPTALNLLRQYFAAKGHGVQSKFFWKNSIAAYRWVKRDPSQPQLNAV